MATTTADLGLHPTATLEVTEELIFAVTRRTGLDFGTVANVLFGARACTTPSPTPTAAPVPSGTCTTIAP